MENNSGPQAEEGPRDHEMKDRTQPQEEQRSTPQDASAADLAARDEALSLQARLIEKQRARIAIAAAEVVLESDAEAAVKTEHASDAQTDRASHEEGTCDPVDGQAEAQLDTQNEVVPDSQHGSTVRHDSQVNDHVGTQNASRFEEYLLPSGGSEQVEIIESSGDADELRSHDTESMRAAADLLNLRNERLQTLGAHEEPSPEVVDLTATSDDAADSEPPTRRRGYHGMYLASLQSLCRQRGLNRNGTKALLIERLQADDGGRAPPNPRTRRFNARQQPPASGMGSFPAQPPTGMSQERFQILLKQQMLNQQRAIAVYLGGPHQPARFRQQVMQSEADVNPAMAQAVNANYQAMLRQMRRQPAQPEQRRTQPSWPNGERIQGPEQRHLAPGYWREQNRLFAPSRSQTLRTPPSQRKQPGAMPTFTNRTLPKPNRSQDSHPPGYTFYAAMPVSFGGLDLGRYANGREKGFGEATPPDRDNRLGEVVTRWKERHMQKWDSRGTVTDGSGDRWADLIPDLVLDEDDAVEVDEGVNG